MYRVVIVLLTILIPTRLFCVQVSVYILDNGVRPDHIAFEGLALESVDIIGSGKEGIAEIVPDSRSPDEAISYGDHATLVAGLVVDRVSEVKVVSVRTLDADGKGSWSDFLKGVHWIINHHPQGQPAVANLSLGGIPDPRIGELVAKAIDDLVKDGVTVVVAAGNEGEDVAGRIPSTLDSVISVGAVSLFNYRLRSSNYGSCVDIYAPGENLSGPGGKHPKARSRDSGTSMASAVVTGHVAAHLTGHPDASPGEVKAWLLDSARRGSVKNVPGAKSKEQKENILLLQE